MKPQRVEDTDFVTATMYRLFTLTWKKLVEPRVMMGDRTSLFETTWIRNTSAMDRLVNVVSYCSVEAHVQRRVYLRSGR